MNYLGIGLVLILLGSVMAALPTSPFRQVIALIDSSSPIFRYLNWFFPVSQMVAIMQAWLAVVAIYYTITIAARWIKLVGE